MNEKKRRRLNEAKDLLSQASGIVDDVLQEEQDSFNNLPESIQESERGQKMEAAIDSMQDAIDSISDATQILDEVVN